MQAPRASRYDYMEPSQGRLGWYCGFMLGKDTKNYYHAHDYVESFINHKSSAEPDQPTSTTAAATPPCKPSEMDDKAVAKSLDIGNPARAPNRRTFTSKAGRRTRRRCQQAWGRGTRVEARESHLELTRCG